MLQIFGELRRTQSLAMVPAIAILAGCDAFRALPIARSRPHQMHCGNCGDHSPEELLLDATRALQAREIERAQDLLEQARHVCAELGGATDEQTELLGLVSSRLPPRKAPKSEIDAAISTPHHVYRPPAPSVSELAATAKAKRSGRVAACAGTSVRIVY